MDEILPHLFNHYLILVGYSKIEWLEYILSLMCVLLYALCFDLGD